MKIVPEQRLSRPIPQRYYVDQLDDAKYVGRHNRRNMQELGRLGLAYLLRATELNNGIVPLPEQIRIQRLLVRKARRDAKCTR